MLTTHGFGVQVDPILGLNYEETVDMEREQLKRSYQAVRVTRDWMDSKGQLRPGRAACFWTVDLEGVLGRLNIQPRHIAQGIVILAALSLGSKIHRIRGSLGARIGKREIPS